MTRRAVPWLVLSGILIAALSLRAPIIALTPVLPEIIHDLDVNATSAGMLTTAPVLMFAVLTPLAALIIRRAGPEIALFLSLAGIIAGTLVRVIPGFGAMLTGMLIIGASITVGNIVIPVIIRRDMPPERTVIATAAYAAMLNVGSLITALGTAPLADVTGWPLALLLWVLLTVAGLALWSVHIVRSRSWGSAEQASGEPTAPRREVSGLSPDTLTGPMPVLVENKLSAILRRPVLWLLLAAFAAQLLMYYALSTWLPTILIDMTGADASEAGALASIFQGVAIIGALIAPALMRYLGGVATGVLMAACWLIMVLGILLAPNLTWLWASFGAIAHSCGFVLIFTGLVGVARSDAEAATMSAVIQGGGYLISTVGAPLMGALHESTGAWQLPLVIILGVIVGYLVVIVSAMILVRGRRA